MAFFNRWGLKAMAVLTAFAAAAALLVSGCSKGSGSDYVGTWMGIDDSRSNYSVYQYDILQSENGADFVVRVTQSHYDISGAQDLAVWTSTEPHYFRGALNEKGVLVTDIGNIVSDSANFRLIYGNINLVRKSKNAEAKFKYVARTHLEKLNPGMRFND